MRIASVARALPPHEYPQKQLIDAFKRHWAKEHYNPARLDRLHQNVLVGSRHLALPLEAYDELETWGQANDAWIRVAQDVGGEAIQSALSAVDLQPTDLDAIFTVTVTGVATPSLDARLVNRLGLKPSIKRNPIFGLGCVAGAAGLARAADYVKAYPEHLAVLLSVELCSLTLQRRDLSIPNLIATGLFGDGAAAVLVAGAEHPLAQAAPEGAPEVPGTATNGRTATDGPSIVATRSVFYPDTEGVMGWDISETGFKIVLSATVPQMVTDHLRADVDAFLAEHNLRRDDIATWICHPGGPKVLAAMEEALEIDREALALTWTSLQEVGNLSSTSVLLVLEDTLRQRRPPTGSWGVCLAMGPGFCSEVVLLKF